MGSSNLYLNAGGRDWAEHQLREAGYSPDDFVVAVVRQFFDTVDNCHDQMPETTEAALPIVAKLILGEPLTEAEWTQAKLDEGYRWVPVMPRSVQMGDVVRVRQDAYSDPRMAQHNGQQGRVSAIRNGIHVIYDNAEGVVMGVRHQSEHLERRIKLAPRAKETNDA